MKSLFILIILFQICCQNTMAQSVVRVRMPAQSEKGLSVETLYNEALPTGISIVLGVVGYEIKGGTAPYQYEWLKNNQVIAMGEVVVINPERGSNYVLRVKDKNMCVIETSINVSNASKAAKSYLSETVKINVQQLAKELSIEFEAFVPENLNLHIFDLQGKLQMKQAIYGNCTVAMQLAAGAYLVVLGNEQMYHVQKIILN
jgi:hypothetical protein